MPRYFIVFALTTCCSQLLAQKYDSPFGEFKEAELRQALEMEYYPADTSAGALILYEKGTVERSSERTRITHLRRVKIFKNSAIEEWSNMARRADASGITHVRGNCYTLVNGTLTKRPLTDQNIYKSQLRRGLDVYSAAMPNVVPGSIVEFEFETNLTRYYSYPDWVFQHSIPTLMSEFFVSGKYGFNADVSGLKKPEYKYDNIRGIRHWWLENAPAFHPEVLMPHPTLFRATLNTFYEALPWDVRAQRLWKDFDIGVLINGRPSWQRKAEEIVTGITDPKEKVKAIVDHVKATLTWDGYNGIEAYDMDATLNDKKGSSSDINIYMISLLRKADIEVNPVFIEPRDYGPYHEHFQTMEQFDYVIGQVAIGKDTIYVDATDRDLPYDVLPYRCLNERGLVLLKKDMKWVDIKPRVRNRVTMESTLTLNEDGTFSGDVIRKADGYAGQLWRKAIKNNDEKFIGSLVNSNLTVTSKAVVNADKVEQPVTIKFEATTDAHAMVSGDKIYVTQLAFTDSTDLFKSDKRLYPIDLVVPQEQVQIFNFKIPDGYTVEQLPEGKVISLPANSGKATFNFSSTAEQVQMLVRVVITRTYFGEQEFSGLKDFHQRVVAKVSEPVVLRKK